MIETLNNVAVAWARFMASAALDSWLVLAAVAALWWGIRRRASAQLGYGLFLLVLVRLLVPVELPVPESLAIVSPKHVVYRAAGRLLAGVGMVQSGQTETATVPTAAPTVAAKVRPHARARATADAVASPSAHRGPAESDAIAPLQGPVTPSLAAAPGSRLSNASLLMLAWAMAVLGLSAMVVLGQWRIRRLVRQGTSVPAGSLPVDLAHLCRLAGLRGSVRVVTSPAVTVPAVCGVFRPCLLLPPNLLELPAGQLAWILLHELAHIGRKDVLVIVAQRALQIVHFFNPATWLASWAADQLREYSCDDAALAACGVSRRECGQGFLTVVLQACEEPAMSATPLGFLNRGEFIRRRLSRILDGRHRPSVRLSARALVTLLVAGVVMVPSLRVYSTDAGDKQGRPGGPAAQEPAANLVLRRLPIEFMDYYCVQKLNLRQAEPAAFCQSARPILISRRTNAFGLDGWLDESQGTGRGYDTLYVDANGDGDPTNDPIYRAMRTGRLLGLEGYPLVAHFEDVRIPGREGAGTFARVQVIVEKDDSLQESQSYVANIAPQSWAVGTVSVAGASLPAALINNTWSEEFADQRGVDPRWLDRDRSWGDSDAFKGNFLLLGAEGESQLQPGNPNGWFGQGGSPRCLLTPYLVLDSGIYQVRAQLVPEGVNLNLAAAQVDAGTLDTTRGEWTDRLSLFGKRSCVLLHKPAPKILVPADTYYAPHLGECLVTVPAGGMASLQRPAGPAGKPIPHDDQVLYTWNLPDATSSAGKAARPAAVPEVVRQAVPARLATHTKMLVQVLRRSDRQPLADAAVVLWTWDPLGCDQQAVATGADGRCALLLPSGKELMAVTVKAAGFVPATVRWRLNQGSDPPPEYTMLVEPGTRIGGVIRNETGEPIEGVKISLNAPCIALPGLCGPDVSDHVVRTDKAGRWLCDIMPALLNDVWIRLEHPSYISDVPPGRTLRPSIEQLRDLSSVMIMEQGVTVVGSVVDPEGNPIAGAGIYRGPDLGNARLPAVRTDTQGSFRLPNVPRGEQVLTVQAREYAADLKRVQVGVADRPVTFQLSRGRTVAGQVVDAAGKGVPFADVRAGKWRDCYTLQWSTKTDSTGRFTWDHAPEYAVQIDVAKNGHTYIRGHDLPADQGEVLLQLVGRW